MITRARTRSRLGANLILVVGVGAAWTGGCDGDGAQQRPGASDRTPHSSRAETESGPESDRDGSLPGGGEPLMDASRASCAATPIPEGELQNRASGASVFGQVVGGEVGQFDAFGNTECGVAGVRVCLLGTDACTESDAAGQFVLADLPDEVDAEISLEKPDFGRALRLVQLRGAPVNLRRTRVLRLAPLRSLLATIGEMPDDSKGSILAVPIAAGEGIGTVIVPEGVSITLMPGDRAPVYSRGAPESGGPSSDELDPSLSVTRFGGWGLFPAVEPGDYVLRFERDGVVCGQSIPGSSHGVDDSGQLKIKVVAGFTTSSVAAFCS